MAMPLTKDGDNIAVQGGLRNDTGNAASVTAFHVGSINAYAAALVDGSGNQLGTVSNPIATTIDSAISIGEVELTDGTNITNVLKSDGSSAGLNGLKIANTSQTQSYSTTSTGALTAYVVEGYASVSVDIISVLSGGSTQFQISNDNTNWRTLTLIRSDIGEFTNSTTSTGKLFSGNLLGAKYFRLNLTGTGSTASGTISFSTQPVVPPLIGASLNSNGGTGVAFGSPSNSDGNTGNFSTMMVDNYPQVFDGTNWDRIRSANAGATTTGTGVLGSGMLVFDGTHWQKQGGDNNGAWIRFWEDDSALNDATTNSPSSLQTNNGNPVKVSTYLFVFNGATWDRQRSNITGQLLAAGQTTTQSNKIITTYNARHLTLLVNISAFTSGTLTVVISGVSTNYTYTLLSSAALASQALTTMRIGPDITPSTNIAAQIPLSPTVSVTATVSGGGSLTYGIDYVLSI